MREKKGSECGMGNRDGFALRFEFWCEEWFGWFGKGNGSKRLKLISLSHDNVVSVQPFGR